MPPRDDPTALLNELIGRFHARRPMRAGSLVVTLFGDAVMPRGGSLWLGTLSDIFAACAIDAGVIRTALSRLVTEGLFTRAKDGRLAFYALSDEGRALFAGAEQRIYDGRIVPWDGTLRLWFSPEMLSADARATAERESFGVIGGQWLLAARDQTPPLPMLSLRATTGVAEARQLIATAYRLEELAARYRIFIADFTRLHEALREPHPFSDLSALVLRLLLIHDWRRIVLRDPRLPSALLPQDWPGLDARAIATALYRRLLAPSERWLDMKGRGPAGALPPPRDGLFRRFSARDGSSPVS